jgi:hypothetical protein
MEEDVDIDAIGVLQSIQFGASVVLIATSFTTACTG